MPNRILKESVCTSETIDQMTPFQETLFYRLIVNCDDYGRMDARPAILKARLFPLKTRLSLSEVESALRALAGIGCVELYEVEKKPYLCFPSWEVHQTVRAKKSKYPAPESGVKTSESICKQEKADAPVFVFEFENPNPIRESKDSPEPQAASGPPVCVLPLNTGEEYPVTEEQTAEWEKLYPAVDVVQALNAMRGWCLANPSKRKTRKGITAFINRWLAKEQDRGGNGAARLPAPGNRKKSFAELAAEMEET